MDGPYTRLLMQQPELSLTQVMLLDRIHKGLPISRDEQLERKKHQRVEARCPNPMGSADMATMPRSAG